MGTNGAMLSVAKHQFQKLKSCDGQLRLRARHRRMGTRMGRLLTATRSARTTGWPA